MTQVLCGDLLEVSKQIPTVDLVMCSPPYEDARTYGIDFNLKGQDWVDWAVERYVACLSVCRGLVVWVVEGKTRQYRWSATPALLLADLHRRGVHLRKPPAFCRVGIPGSGGPDWLRNDWEWCICATNGGKLLWSDNTAMGHPPKYGCFGGNVPHGYSGGDVKHVRNAGGPFSSRKQDGTRVSRVQREYEKANPGNVISLTVGGGKMGHGLSHENEAPYPLKLAEFFIKSFCPPGGTVWDPFSGSGTTAHAAIISGRNSISSDIRESQCDLTRRRIASVTEIKESA